MMEGRNEDLVPLKKRKWIGNRETGLENWRFRTVFELDVDFLFAMEKMILGSLGKMFYKIETG